MTRRQYDEELAHIATLTDEQVCTAYNVDNRHEAIEALNAEFDDEEEDEEEYWQSYAEDMLIERKNEYKAWREAV